MGLADTTSHAIWAFVLLTVLGGGAVAAFQHIESITEARAQREQATLDALGVRAEQASFCYGAAATRVNLTATNMGDAPVDLALVDLLVDGVPTDFTTSGQGSIWLPGESLSFYAPGVLAEPDRAKLVLPRGALAHAEKVTCRVLTTILLTPSSATMDIGGTQDFDVTGRDQFGEIFEAAYTWSTTTGSIVALDADTARLTAGTVAGTWAVTAESEGVSQDAVVVVKPGAPATVLVSPSVTAVPAGGERAFTATVLDAYGNVNATAPVVWATNAGAITQGGVLTAQTTAQADREVTATSEGVVGSAEVDVVADAPVSLDVTPDVAGVPAGGEHAFTVTALDAYGNENDTATIVWTTDAGAITQDGVLTAQTTPLTGGEARATFGALSDAALVDVYPEAPATVTVSPDPITVPAGGTRAFTATVRDSYGNVNSTAPVVWSTNAGSIDAAGTLTAQTLAATGKTVTATSGAASGIADVDVTPADPATATISPTLVGVPAGGEQAFTATLYDAYGNVNSTATTVWTTNAGSVTQAGILTAQTLAQNGRSVTATSGAASAVATVDVWPAAPASMTISPEIAGVTAGGTQAFTATAYDAYGNANTTATKVWSTNAGTITQGGVLTAQTTAAAARFVNVASGAASADAIVDVIAGAPTTITVAPTPTSVTAGATAAFTSTARDQYGNVNSTAAISWSTNAGSISAGGVLTAQTTAQTGRTVTATSGAVSGQASVDIVAGPVATVTVAPATATLNMNATQQFTATMRDQYGNVNTTASLSWSATAGSISAGGLYTAPSITGGVTVTATANGQQGTAAVTVQRSVHVDAMATYKSGVPASSFKRGTDTVETRVTIRDHANVLVQGASVTVEYVDPDQVVAATRTATTDASGISSTSYVIPNGAPRNGWTVRVTIMTGTGLYYDSASNVVSSVAFTVTN